MAIGKQGKHVAPVKFPPQSGSKPGGGSGPAGGSVAQGKTPKPVGGNKKNIK